jgi:putative transposase
VEQREAVQFLVAGGLSVQRACTVVQMHRSSFRYVAKETDDMPLLGRIHGLAVQHPRYGYRRISVLLNRTEKVREKRVRRLWKLHRLQVRRVVRKRVRRVRPARLQAAYVGHIWAYDFVEDALVDGTPLRIVTVMDEFTFLRAGTGRGTQHLGRTRDWRADCLGWAARGTGASAQ